MALMNEIEVSQALLQKANLVRREGWGAVLPSGKDDRLEGVISHVIFTYTAEEACYTGEECAQAVRRMQTYHMNNGRFDIPYSFILGGDGNAYVGRGWRRAPIVPAESGCNNLRTLVFARIGPIKGGFVQDFEGAQYILRFCQRESLTTEKIEVKRYYNDWNTY